MGVRGSRAFGPAFVEATEGLTPMAMSNGFVRGGPLILLRLEGAAILAAATLAYARLGHSWWMFVALFLLPDVSMLLYFVNRNVGAASYNVVHTLTSPAVLAGLGLIFDSSLAMSFAAIWVAHIGLDRMLGFGLKYATGFADTHLGRLGAKGAVSAP